jgi:hypothetical protein
VINNRKKYYKIGSKYSIITFNTIYLFTFLFQRIFSESIESLKGDWKMKKIEHSKQTDTVNCGIIVCKLFKALINEPEIEIINFEQHSIGCFRNEIYETLINSEKKNYSKCSKCGYLEDHNCNSTEWATKNNFCPHSYHKSCFLNEDCLVCAEFL